MQRPRLQLLCVLVTCGTIGGPAAAREPSSSDLFDDAEMVVLGTVSKITYGMSHAAAKGDRAVPVTLVTVTVQRVLAGPQDARTVTLRLVGGPLPNGAILVASEFPTFDVGDRDVLFVLGNGVRACPLVGCARGRIRIVRGHAYFEDGSELRLESGELRRGPVRDLEEVRTHTIAGHAFKAVYAAPKLDVATAPAPKAGQAAAAPPLDEARLLEWAWRRAAASRDPKLRPPRKLPGFSHEVVAEVTPTPPPPSHAPVRPKVTP